MKMYEIVRRLARPFMPTLYVHAHRDLRRLVRTSPSKRPAVLDVGGRRSPYTIGLDADITVQDLPRENLVQAEMHLGFTGEMMQTLRRSRSNVVAILVEDMTESRQPAATCDGVACVEVIEHVERDEAFVAHLARVLKPGGWVYLTTPNGDYIHNEPPNRNPDHVKHFSRQQLHDLLASHFDEVAVKYGVKTGKYRVKGLRSMGPRRPLQTLVTMACNVINRLESIGVEQMPKRTAHLVAVARKVA